MINIIRTAIITIIISFASGLMLDYFTNLAPKILCNVRNGIPIELNNKKSFAYIITVNNISNKTIHELTLNIQSSQTNLKSTDATITKGLKFDSSIKDNILDVYIPFLSKGDEFSVTVYVEDQYTMHNKPVVIIRSPENFKEINSLKQKGILSLLFNIPKNINQVILKMKKAKAIIPDTKYDFTTVTNNASGTKKTINKENREVLYRNKKPNKSKKAMIIIVSIILVMFVGIMGKFYFKGLATNAPTPIVNNQSTGAIGSIRGTASTGTTRSGRGTTGTTSTTGSPSGTVSTGTTRSGRGTTGTTGSAGGTTETTGTTGSAGGTTGTTNTTGSAVGTTGSSGSKGTTGGTTGTTGTTGSAGGTTGSTGSTGSAGGTGSSGSKGTTGGTTATTGN